MPDDAPLERELSPRASLFPGVDGVLAGRFHIEARLGAGGMGEVYRARDTTLRRLVAIKRTQHAATEADRKRFLHEGQRASALNHPGIAAIYDVFTEGGEVYLIMEYVEGETLRSRLARPISESEFSRIAIESAAALAAAHDKGILHRDIICDHKLHVFFVASNGVFRHTVASCDRLQLLTSQQKFIHCIAVPMNADCAGACHMLGAVFVISTVECSLFEGNRKATDVAAGATLRSVDKDWRI